MVIADGQNVGVKVKIAASQGGCIMIAWLSWLILLSINDYCCCHHCHWVVVTIVVVVLLPIDLPSQMGRMN
jgi:hypothetical protein